MLSSRVWVVFFNDGGWWFFWYCYLCVGWCLDISVELVGGGILWFCGGFVFVFIVVRCVGVDVVGCVCGIVDWFSFFYF